MNDIDERSQLGSRSFHETNNLRARPAGNAFACWIIMSVQHAGFRDVNPGVRRVLPTCEFAADKGLKMTIYDAILDHPAIRSVTAGEFGFWLT